MEILRERLPDEHDFYNNRATHRVHETAPNPLVNAATYLGRNVGKHFPLLQSVNIHSTDYVDEVLWLDAEQSGILLREFHELRKLCRHEAFLKGFDGKMMYERWKGSYEIQEFEAWLDEIEQMIAEATENNYWVRINL
jgi:hypothetical protein